MNCYEDTDSDGNYETVAQGNDQCGMWFGSSWIPTGGNNCFNVTYPLIGSTGGSSIIHPQYDLEGNHLCVNTCESMCMSINMGASSYVNDVYYEHGEAVPYLQCEEDSHLSDEQYCQKTWQACTEGYTWGVSDTSECTCIPI